MGSVAARAQFRLAHVSAGNRAGEGDVGGSMVLGMIPAPTSATAASAALWCGRRRQDRTRVPHYYM